MKNDWNSIVLDYDFLQDDTGAENQPIESYKILISDDEPQVHHVTKMMLHDFHLDGRSLTFIDTYSEKDTLQALSENNDIAILLQDVVMEKNDTGLCIINYLRNILKNNITRIVLRTGQPGEAPEEKIILDYDINDYCLKTELTVSRLKTTIISALRSYRDITHIDRYRKGLERVIEASANLFTHHSLNDFLTSILNQLSTFYMESEGLVYIRGQTKHQVHGGFVTIEQSNAPIVMAATGSYVPYIGKDIRSVDTLRPIYQWMIDSKSSDSLIIHTGHGFIIKNSAVGSLSNYIYIEGKKEIYDFELIKLFLSNYTVALDNYLLNNMIFTAQKEVILILGQIAEKHFSETGSHVDRVSSMMCSFAQIMDFPHSECEKLRLACVLHDIGKIGLPDAILKKPGKLTKDEFSIIKSHPKLGYEILSRSKLDILRMASEIALHHHEKYDGTGYPDGLRGDQISLVSRMTAIIDVYDAMSHKRVYKDASPLSEIKEYIQSQSDKHFDGKLVRIFMDHFTEIITSTSGTNGNIRLEEH